MWKCPKCGRTFRSAGQHHYCGQPPVTIDEYISEQEEEIQPILRKVRETLKAALPESIEKISWSMPTYWQGRNIIHFAAQKAHLGIYPGAEAVAAFQERLAGCKTSKGAIQFPYKKEIPYELIAEIAKWCLQHYYYDDVGGE